MQIVQLHRATTPAGASLSQGPTYEKGPTFLRNTRCRFTSSSYISVGVETSSNETIPSTAIANVCKPYSAQKMYKLLRSLTGGGQCVFPNVEIALHIYLTLPSTNAEGERSFSTLKRIRIIFGGLWVKTD